MRQVLHKINKEKKQQKQTQQNPERVFAEKNKAGGACSSSTW